MILVNFIIFFVNMLYTLFNTFSRVFRLSPPNPFNKDSRKPRKPYEHDPEARSYVLQQNFSIDKVPFALDAVVIGSGIGGLTTAVILAKSGKKVLVLEQGKVAGGCCSTIPEQGLNFDIGVHYVGEMGDNSFCRTFFDQITDGQVEWTRLEDQFDIVYIGDKHKQRIYPVTAGLENWKVLLKEQFPAETIGIDQYFAHIHTCENAKFIFGALKMMPLWFVHLLVKTGILRVVTNLWKDVYTRSALELVQDLTHNHDLQTMLLYYWGDVGTLPSRTYFSTMALISKHLNLDGSYYPIGGPSELPFNMIPIIEKTGGRVLVSADVDEIFFTKGKVSSICVKHNGEKFTIPCRMVISDAGLYNTIMKLVPTLVAKNSYYYEIANELSEPCMTVISCYAGLDGTPEQLGIKPQNYWFFLKGDDIDKEVKEYLNADLEDLIKPEADIPSGFISFNSAKDPEWNMLKERRGKTTMEILIVANWDWFKDWKNVEHKGTEYKHIKEAFGNKMIARAVEMFPKIKDRIIFRRVGTPLAYDHVIRKHHGGMYGLDHAMARYAPWMEARLRAKTDLPGLYLTGQDVLDSGVVSAAFSGALTAQACLGRPVLWDLYQLHTKLFKQRRK